MQHRVWKNRVLNRGIYTTVQDPVYSSSYEYSLKPVTILQDEPQNVQRSRHTREQGSASVDQHDYDSLVQESISAWLLYYTAQYQP